MNKYKLKKLRAKYEEARMAFFSNIFPNMEETYSLLNSFRKEYFDALDEMEAKEL